jgi:hypothetical protein
MSAAALIVKLLLASLLHLELDWSRRLLDRIPEIALVLTSTAAGIWAGGRWLSPTSDPGIWWSMPERLASGERLYRDIYLQYGPLSPYLVSWLARPFGFSATAILVLSWIPAVIAALLLLRLARPFLSTLERLVLAAILLGVGLFAPGLGRLVYPYSPAAVTRSASHWGAPSRPVSGGRASGWLAGSWKVSPSARSRVGLAAAAGLAASTLRSRGERWLGKCLAAFAAVAACGALFVLTSAPLDSLRRDSHVWPLAPPPHDWNRLFLIVAGFGPGWLGRIVGSLRGLGLVASLFALLGLLFARERRPRRYVPVAAVFAVLLVAALLEKTCSTEPRVRPPVDVLSFVVALWALSTGAARTATLSLPSACSRASSARAPVLRRHRQPVRRRCASSGALALLLFLFVFLPGVWPGQTCDPDEKAVRYTRRIWATVLFPSSAWARPSASSASARPAIGRSIRQGRIWADPGADLYSVSRASSVQESACWSSGGQRRRRALPRRSVSPFVTMMPGWLDPGGRASSSAASSGSRRTSSSSSSARTGSTASPRSDRDSGRLSGGSDTRPPRRVVARGTVWRRADDGAAVDVGTGSPSCSRGAAQLRAICDAIGDGRIPPPRSWR